MAARLRNLILVLGHRNFGPKVVIREVVYGTFQALYRSSIAQSAVQLY